MSCLPERPCSGAKRVVSWISGLALGGEEDVDGAAAVGVEAGLVGEEADAEVVVEGGGEGFEGGEVGVFEDVDAGEGGGGRRGKTVGLRSTAHSSQRAR